MHAAEDTFLHAYTLNTHMYTHTYVTYPHAHTCVQFVEMKGDKNTMNACKGPFPYSYTWQYDICFDQSTNQFTVSAVYVCVYTRRITASVLTKVQINKKCEYASKFACMHETRHDTCNECTESTCLPEISNMSTRAMHDACMSNV
jgi:hypothetical protein